MMDIKKLPRNPKGGRALNELVFTEIDDSPDNPRFGLGYHQLYDPDSRVGLLAKLPDITRVGDTIILYWDNFNVQEYDLDQPTIEKGWLSFGVAPSSILDPQGEVYYTLYDHDADDLQTSSTRTIAVNRRVPGGLDPDIATAINEALLPCTVSPSPVSDPSTAVTAKIVQWAYQEVGDELTVMWNNIRVAHPKLSTLGDQDVTIPRDVLEAGGSSDKLLVNYEIRDIVDNYSLVSQPTYVQVEIDPNALFAPRVDEADRATLILDLEALGDNDAHVTVPPYSGNGQPYVVTLNWIGKTPSADISLNLPPSRVEDPVFDHATFTIPNSHMKDIAGGSAVVRYSLVQDGLPETKPSKTTTITITGLPVELAAPVVDEANGTNVIDLADVTGLNVTVSIAAYTGQAAGDRVLLSWKGMAANGTPVNYTDEYEIKSGEETQPINFTVERNNVDPLADGTLELSYQVVFNATGSTNNSAVTTYTVKGAAVGPVSGDESFEAQSLGPLAVNVELPFTDGLIITVVAATPESAISVPGIAEFGERALYCAGNHKIKFDFGGEISTLLFSHALTATAQNKLDFFDVNDALVKSVNLKVVGADPVAYENIVLATPCTYCELTVDAIGTIVDNFIWM